MATPSEAGKAEGFDEPKPEVPHHAGHRDRLRERFNAAGEAALADYELLSSDS